MRITFAQVYEQFVYKLTLLNRQELQSGPIGIYASSRLRSQTWHRVMALTVLFVLPILLLFVVLWRQILCGLTSDALK